MNCFQENSPLMKHTVLLNFHVILVHRFLGNTRKFITCWARETKREEGSCKLKTPSQNYSTSPSCTPCWQQPVKCTRGTCTGAMHRQRDPLWDILLAKSHSGLPEPGTLCFEGSQFSTVHCDWPWQGAQQKCGRSLQHYAEFQGRNQRAILNLSWGWK